MKSFDSINIRNRLLANLKDYVDPSGGKIWNRVLNDSAIQSLLFAMSEDKAETARYFEYNLKEAKWGLMKNPSSAYYGSLHFGYKPHRQISSIGTIVVSHDPVLRGAGSTFFESDLESLSVYTGSNIPVPLGTVISSSGLIPFITTRSVTYTTGLKYLEIPIIQGSRKSILTSTGAQGVSFEKIKFLKSDIEAALDTVSQQFFYTTIYLGGSSASPRSATLIENIYLADEKTLAYDVETARDYSYITLRFGDGISGIKLPTGSTVKLSYLETLGAAGNLSQKYVLNSIDSPLTRTLYCTNLEPTLGGSGNEDMESIRENAPTSYLTQDKSIVTTEAYIANIELIPGIYKAAVSEGTAVDEISGVEQPAILYTALTTSGAEPPASLHADLLARTNKKRPPLDYLKYESPTLAPLSIGIQASVPLASIDLTSTEEAIKDLLGERYGILNQEFKNAFDTSEDISLVRKFGEDNSIAIQNIEEFIEAVVVLPPSTFTRASNGAFFEKTFRFPDLFSAVKKFSDGVPYCLKVQIFFDCPGCAGSSRTIFLIENPDYAGAPGQKRYKVVQYPYISEITTKDYMINSVLTQNVGYEEILPTPGNLNYVDISVTMDYEDELSSGTLTLPLLKRGGSSYINFNAADKDELDSIVSIRVYASPVKNYFSCSEYKEMIYSDEIAVEAVYKEG